MKIVKAIFLSVLLTVTLLLSLCSCREIPEEIGTVGLYYELTEDGTYEVSIGEATKEKISIPPTYEGIAVTAIAKRGFSDSEITDISIPSTVKTIGAKAFMDCALLENVEISGGVKNISTEAFAGCTNLEVIVIPNSVTDIGTSAFSGCTSLKKVEAGKPTVVSGNCFKNCTSLETLVLRKTGTIASLTNVNAFEGLNGKAVDVYVPSALVSSYENGTNWVNVTGASLTFKAIEGSYYETHYADGTVIS